MATNTKKAKISHVQEKWFSDESLRGIISPSHSKNTETSVFCLICQKSVNVSHQGKKDLLRHCQGASHVGKANSIRQQPAINSKFGFHQQNDPLENQIRKAEVKMVGFLAEHNLPIAVADHIGPLVKDIFPDSRIAKGYQCARTKATCILNRAVKPDLQSELINEMKQSCFSICTDGSNDQNLEKMNPVTVRLFDTNQHKVVTKFLDMCLSKSATAVGIFGSIDDVFKENELPWENCISLGVDNTSVNVGRHNSLIVEARKKNANIILMGCPCHIAHNTAKHGTAAFEQVLKTFDIEELLVDLYFHFDYSSKRKNILHEFCEFCDHAYCKILKFHSVRWLGLSMCIERTLKLYPSLQSYFLSQDDEIQAGERSKSRLNRLINSFTNPVTEVYGKIHENSLGNCLISLSGH